MRNLENTSDVIRNVQELREIVSFSEPGNFCLDFPVRTFPTFCLQHFGLQSLNACRISNGIACVLKDSQRLWNSTLSFWAVLVEFLTSRNKNITLYTWCVRLLLNDVPLVD